MQNTFSFSRFGRLFKKHTAEHFKANLMSAGVLVGLLALLMGIAAYLNSNPLGKTEQAIFFILGLLLAGSIFTSMIFTDLSDKKTAIATLTLPASHFEKYFLAWLYSFVIFLVVYTAAFYLVDYIVVNMDNWQNQPKEMVNVFSAAKDDDEVYAIFLIYVFLNALCIWGAIYFQKLHFIKTAFLFFSLLAVLAIFNYFFMEAYLGKEIQAAIPFGTVIINEANQQVNINLPEDRQGFVIIGFMVIAVVLWVASYLRLTEKQV